MPGGEVQGPHSGLVPVSGPAPERTIRRSALRTACFAQTILSSRPKRSEEPGPRGRLTAVAPGSRRSRPHGRPAGMTSLLQLVRQLRSGGAPWSVRHPSPTFGTSAGGPPGPGPAFRTAGRSGFRSRPTLTPPCFPLARLPGPCAQDPGLGLALSERARAASVVGHGRIQSGRTPWVLGAGPRKAGLGS